MAAPWSKLQSLIYSLFDEALNLQIHITPYRMGSQRGSTNLGRYWITLNKKIIFDYPGAIPAAQHEEYYPYGYSAETSYIKRINNALRDYYDCPREDLLTKDFGDAGPVIDIIRAADRRIGQAKLTEWGRTKNRNVRDILQARGWDA